MCAQTSSDTRDFRHRYPKYMSAIEFCIFTQTSRKKVNVCKRFVAEKSVREHELVLIMCIQEFLIIFTRYLVSFRSC